MTTPISAFRAGLAAAATLAATMPHPAAAQSLCGARAEVVGMLQARYGESVRGMGLADRNRIVEIFASDETGSWTIVVTTPRGITCLVASGQHYEDIAAMPGGDPL